MTSKPQRVAVIGAGIMGLAVLRRLSEDKNFQLVCFDRNYDVGGQWLYTDQTTVSDLGKPITSAIYSNLRTNLPKQLMELNGFPTDSLESFSPHKDILAYIKMIVDRSGLRQFIKVYICHRGKPLPSKLTENVIEKTSTFKKFTAKSIILENGEELHIDTAVYCTGYKYDFSFLPKGLIKIGEGNLVSNLYQSILPVEYSTLLFIGLPREVPFFVTSDYQALFIRAVLTGTAKLPPIDEITDMVSRGKFCTIGMSTWLDWTNELAEIAGCEKLKVGKALFDIWYRQFDLWCADYLKCWTVTYKINGPDSYIIS